MGKEMPPQLPFTNDQWELVHIHLDDLTPQVGQLRVPAFTLSPGGPHWIRLSCLCGDLLESVLCWLPSFPYLDTTLPGFLGRLALESLSQGLLLRELKLSRYGGDS